MNIEIANRLVQMRKKNNLSQEELAAKLGISRQVPIVKGYFFYAFVPSGLQFQYS